MGLLQKLKSALGMGTSGRSRQQAEPDVTVERKPSAESERSVKTAVEDGPAAGDDGAESGPAGTNADAPPTDEDTAPTEIAAGDDPAEAAGVDESAGDEPASPPVEEITGIGATYADRLEAAGIETVADLADSDVSTVVEAAQATESRVQDWLEQARNR